MIHKPKYLQMKRVHIFLLFNIWGILTIHAQQKDSTEIKLPSNLHPDSSFSLNKKILNLNYSYSSYFFGSNRYLKHKRNISYCYS